MTWPQKLKRPTGVTKQNYCGVSTCIRVTTASAFVLFVNNGGLTIPSKCVFATIEQCELLFNLYVCQQGITKHKVRKNKMVLEISHYFFTQTSKSVFTGHDDGSKESIIGDDHQIKRIKWTADKYFTMWLFTYGKHYTETVAQNGMRSTRYHSNKLSLFKNIEIKQCSYLKWL